MSQENQEKELTVVGKPEDVTSRFGLGDLVEVHLEMKGQVFLTDPHGQRGMVVALSHTDSEHLFHMPVVQFEKQCCMFNPEALIVVQKADGTPGETEMLEQAHKRSEEARKKEAEKENA